MYVKFLRFKFSKNVSNAENHKTKYVDPQVLLGGPQNIYPLKFRVIFELQKGCKMPKSIVSSPVFKIPENHQDLGGFVKNSPCLLPSHRQGAAWPCPSR
jgi:hypothetical protein